MHPYFELSAFGRELTVPSYQLMAFAGAVAAFGLSLLFFRLNQLKKAPLLLGVMIPMFLLGARLWNVAVAPQAYNGVFQWYTPELKGLSFYGGLLGAFLAVLLFSRFTKQDIWRIFDALVVPAATAFILARTGCYMNGCCAGLVTLSQYGVAFPQSGIARQVLMDVSPFFAPLEVRQYPTQLYEMALATAALVPAVPFLKGKSVPGRAFLLYGTLFSAMRLAILPLRELPYSDFTKHVAYPAIYLALICAGVFLFMQRSNK